MPKQTTYEEAMALMNTAKDEEGYLCAANIFASIKGFKDAEEKEKECKEKAETCRKNKIYDTAMAKMNEGTVSGCTEALSLFRAIQSWNDVINRLITCEQRLEQAKAETYENAMSLLEKASSLEEYAEVSKLLNDIKEYKEIDEMHTIFSRMHCTIPFGRYIQDDTEPAPITWRVLTMKGNKLLLISDTLLECKPYYEAWGDVTWEKSTLRTWLNTEFFEKAFSKEEQARILKTEIKNDNAPHYGTHDRNETKDKVFLLSVEETREYFLDDKERECKATQHTLEGIKKAYDRYGENGFEEHYGKDTRCAWWLRSSGILGDYTAVVRSNGSLHSSGFRAYTEPVGVRPALWLVLQ